jgi:hypothetical protein
MSLAQRKKERAALVTALMGEPWNVFGTLKFINGRRLGRDSAHKILRSYWNRVDRTFFGHAAERQSLRVPRWCFAHEGADSENFHIHFALMAPMDDLPKLCCVLNAIWAQHHPQTAPLAKNWILPVIDRRATALYLTGEYWRMGAATLLDEISWRPPDHTSMAPYQHIQQAQRIAKAVSPFWLGRATQAFLDQQAYYQAQHSLA